MAIYIIIFFALFMVMILSLEMKFSKDAEFFVLSAVFVVLLIFIGLRHEVGGDWDSYLFWYNEIKRNGMNLTLRGIVLSDFGYNIINWLSAKLDLGIYGVNTICAFIYLMGLFKLSAVFQNRYITLFMAYPYLTMVVSTGYTRQATALGFVMLAYYYFLKRKEKTGLILSLIAIFFHKSSIFAFLFLFYLYMLGKKGNPFKKILSVFFVLSLIALTLVVYKEIMDRFYRLYISSRMVSKGGIFRAFMNIVPGVFFFSTIKIWRNLENFKFWFYMGVFNFLFSTIALMNLTFGDRMLLYFYPFQYYIWNELIGILESKEEKSFIVTLIIYSYALVMLVWLNFAVYRYEWIPYDNILFRILK